MKKKSIYRQIKNVLAVASQTIIAAPVKLPPKVVLVAKYVAMALGVLEAAEGTARKEGAHDADE